MVDMFSDKELLYRTMLYKVRNQFYIMSFLCQYKDLFGKPNEGLRKYRIADIAIYDVSVVVLISIGLSYFTKIPLWIVLVVLFVSGVIVHRAFCVRTGVDKWLFPNAE
jgi:hypothetical protein